MDFFSRLADALKNDMAIEQIVLCNRYINRPIVENAGVIKLIEALPHAKCLYHLEYYNL